MKSFHLAGSALALGALAFAASPAFADHGGPHNNYGGAFLGQSLVISVTGSCITAPGDTFLTVLQAGNNDTRHDNNHGDSWMGRSKPSQPDR